jgi:uncharacterized membrane protein
MPGLQDVAYPDLQPAAPTPTAPTRDRLDSIDLLRGVIMVVMALDHVRDYFSAVADIDPVNLTKTNPALFLTRLVTHFCAPTFLFLAGTGAFLYGSRGRTRPQLAWFLLSRGLWLAFLEITLVRLAWSFNLDYHSDFGAGVLWAIGWSMVAMSALVFLPTSAVATIGVGIVAFHNLLDTTTAEQLYVPKWLWVVLHSPGGFDVSPAFQIGSVEVPSLSFGTAYCILPWLGVMAAGYGLGAMFLLERSVRRPQLIALGLALTVLFVVIRFGNAYGDPKPTGPPDQPAPATGTVAGPWAQQDTWWSTAFSFVNCQKYPPSLLYVLMTLGPAITALGLFDRPAGVVGRFFVTFGRVPLFYYLLHIPLIHGLMVLGDYLRFGASPFANKGPWPSHTDYAPGYGYDLPVVYLVWIGVILLLYPVCRWYGALKARHRDGILSYL